MSRWIALLLWGASWGCGGSAPRTAAAPAPPHAADNDQGQHKAPEPPSHHAGHTAANPVAEPGAQASTAGDETTRCNAQHEVTQQQVDAFYDDIDGVSRTVRIRFPREDGVAIGLSLHGIKKDSLLAAWGFENADVVRTVNGHPLATPEQSTEAYTALRGANTFRFDILRAARPWISCVRVAERPATPPPPT